MFVAVHLPQLPLVVRIHTESDWDDHNCPVLNDQPVVLLNIDDPDSTSERQRDRAHVLHANEFARTQFGIEPGMTTIRALAHCPDELVIFTRRPDLENDSHLALLTAANEISPDIESTSCGSVIGDLSTLPDALRAPQHWAQQVIDTTLSRLGLPVHLAIATTPDLAMLAALTGPPLASVHDPYQPTTTIAPPITNPASFANIPMRHLLTMLEPCGIAPDAAKEITGLFPQWGLRTIGDLTALPRAGLSDRLGSSAVLLHDLLTARHCRLLSLFRPADSLARHTDLEFPITETEPLLFLLGRMLGTMCARLESTHQYVAQLHLSLHYEAALRPPYEHTINLPEPTANRSHLLDALHYHLESFTAPNSGMAGTASSNAHLDPSTDAAIQHPTAKPHSLRVSGMAGTASNNSRRDSSSDAGVTQPTSIHRPRRVSGMAGTAISGVSLDATPVPRSAKQHQLFERALKDPARFAITLTKLESLLGKGRIGAPVTDNSHRPDTAAVRPWFLNGKLSVTPEATTEMQSGIPLRRFRPPVPVTVATESSPSAPHPEPTAILSGPVTGAIQACRGPVLISGHWWDPDTRWQQTEWDVELARNTLLRLSHHNQLWRIEGAY